MKTTACDLSDFSDVYRVVECERDGGVWLALRLYGNLSGVEGIPEFEHIFGLPKSEKGQAFLEYWRLRLNRAFINGWFGRGGQSNYPDAGYYEELERLYQIAFTK